MLIILYLAAIVAANLSIAAFGPGVAILNAFLFIGLDLTARDRLHEEWRGRGLWLKMLGLITAGSVISFLLNTNAGPIALASFAAFGLAGIADALTYHILRHKTYFAKVNSSNLSGALVDSVVFPWLAFGGFMPLITLGQFLAKIAGGFIWAWLLKDKNNQVTNIEISTNDKAV